MSVAKTVDVVIRYDGLTADSGQLNLHQAAASLTGIAHVVNVIVHAFVNEGEIRERLTTPEGAKTFLSAAKKGCFEEVVTIEFGAEVVKRIKPTVITDNFWDFLTSSISAAVGREFDPSMPMVKKIVAKNETFFEEVAEELETALQRLHRPIKSSGANTITFARKGKDMVVLDEESLKYVSVLDQEKTLSYWTGNVTKYNSISGFGRVYIDEFLGTLPFKIDNFKLNISTQRAASASLNERVNQEGGRRRIGAFAVRNSLGTIKRLTIHEFSIINE